VIFICVTCILCVIGGLNLVLWIFFFLSSRVLVFNVCYVICYWCFFLFYGASIWFVVFFFLMSILCCVLVSCSLLLPHPLSLYHVFAFLFCFLFFVSSYIWVFFIRFFIFYLCYGFLWVTLAFLFLASCLKFPVFI
jgi:hypothetical protein